MNWHLFLDILAVTWGVMFTLHFVLASLMRGQGNKCAPSKVEWTVFFMIATLCWAWIIAS